jgi:hypothetical protein
VDKENYIDATVIVHIKYTADLIIDVSITCFESDYYREKFYKLKYSIKILK